ncbi:MAG TPA: hypothetical protein VNT51_01830 [Miltoncostaeaceae bacterium]|nr:hypothetical protein [Miltoncostaeaceae bacterium]
MAGLAGCSSEPLEADTRPLPAGVTVSARQYLSDAAGTVAAMDAFAAALGRAGPRLTPPRAQALAPDLAEAAGTACALQRRLAAQRLEDARLEAQRTALVQPLADACDAMRGVAEAARRGDPETVAERAGDLRVVFERIRASAGA